MCHCPAAPQLYLVQTGKNLFLAICYFQYFQDEIGREVMMAIMKKTYHFSEVKVK